MGRLTTGSGGEKTFIYSKLSGVEYKKASVRLQRKLNFLS